MKRRLPSWRTFALAAILVVIGLSSAYHYVPESMKRPNMTELSSRLQPLFEKTKTVCFGRFVIEVPSTATVVYGPAQVPMSIERLPSKGSQLAEYVSAKENALKQEERKPTGGGKTLYKETLDGVLPNQKIVIGYENFSSPFYRLESFLKIGDDLFVQNTSAVVRESEAARSENFTLPQRLSKVNSVARRLRARADDDIPNEQGVCIDGAFIADPEQPASHENITLGVRLAEFPDVHLSIRTQKTSRKPQPHEAIEPRLERAREAAYASGLGSWYSRIKVFRRDERQIGDWNGYEVMARLPAKEHSTEVYEFAFLSQGIPHDPFHPIVDIKLNTGVKKNKTAKAPTSLTDEEAVALWDKLTSSIRVRPAGESTAPTSQAEPPKLPLGELAATGRLCPQTGWWECVDAGNVQGGRRQHFTAGEAMPHAILLGEPSVWQKLKGERPMHQIATVWKLVGHDEEPAVAATAATAPEADASIPESDDQDMPPQADADDDDAPKAG